MLIYLVVYNFVICQKILKTFKLKSRQGNLFYFILAEFQFAQNKNELFFFTKMT